jgi:hypothetical protein
MLPLETKQLGGKLLPHSDLRNKEVLHRFKEERNILHTITRRRANWIGHILRRNCLLKHLIEGKIDGRVEVKGKTRKRTEAAIGCR